MSRRTPDKFGVTCDIRPVVFALSKGLGTARSLAIWLCYKYDHDALLTLELEPASYGDANIAFCSNRGPEAFAKDLVATEFLSKYKGLKLSVNPKEEAIRKFKNAEEVCSATNARLKLLRTASMPRLEAIILIARRKISEVLGLRCEADFQFGWGPGSTSTIKGDVAWDKKILEKRISVTAAALPLAQTAIGADLHWCRARGIDSEGPCSLLPSEFLVVSGNTIITVPKNAGTDRTIAIEPTANIYLQKGLGSWLRRRIRKICRINLDSQEKNQLLAALLTWATIDLKAASDTIAYEVIRLLFPDEWFNLMDYLRSPSYVLDGKMGNFSKWSSMGNGFTFELETLVFWALSYAVQSISGSSNPRVVTYGDDILVPVQFAEATIQTLQDFGFFTNAKKTHYTSLYRESCGAHFFDGHLVTPIYQKEVPTHVVELYHMANRLRHLAARLGGYFYSDSCIRSAWLASIKLIGPSLVHLPLVLQQRWRGSGVLRHQNRSKSDVSDREVYADYSLEGGLHLSLEDCTALGRPVSTYGQKHKRIVFRPKKRRYDPAAGLAYVLGKDAALNSEDVSLRGRGVYRMRRTRIWQSYCSNVWL